MSDLLLLIFELIGTVAFAISGAMTGLRKKMDIFGVVILGLITAVGGGIIRDLVLGNTPPVTFKNPVYSLVAIAVSIIFFLPFVRKLFTKKQKFFDNLLLIMDSLGLAVFTVVGIQTASSMHFHNIYILIFVGVVTGVGGGVIRDTLAGDMPYIFVKHFYATASLIGAVITSVLWSVIGEGYSMLIGVAVIFVLRLFAAHYHWKLPKIE